MDFFLPREITDDVAKCRAFLQQHLSPHLSQWYEQGAVPRSFFSLLAEQGWFSFSFKDGRISKRSALREALLAEQMAKMAW